jgi:hypothetical protein
LEETRYPYVLFPSIRFPKGPYKNGPGSSSNQNYRLQTNKSVLPSKPTAKKNLCLAAEVAEIDHQVFHRR